VVLNPAYRIEGLADSKKLSEKNRTKLEIVIKTYSMAWSVASASVDEIDQLNILQASLLAMKRAVESLLFTPDQVLVDGNHIPRLNYPTRAIIRGDSLIPEISAASILAKTARDAEMMRLHQDFPHYGFDRHKGYPTAAHIIALQEYGVSREHRRSFAPVKKMIMQCGP
jgi:ribonuclease HII